jgi:LPS export ABC transporter permease LptG/LPS export ABC transporter permease LptF
MPRFRPSILFRYVFGEILSPTLLGLGVYMLVFLASFLFELVELAIKKDLPATTVLRLLLTILPRVLVLTIPMAVLLGVLVGIGRLSTDSEVIALRASGISYWRLLAPTLTVAAAGWAVCSYLMLDVEPRANLKRQQLTNEMMYAADVRREIKPRVFFEEVPGLLLYADEVHRGGDFLERVFIYQSEEGGRELLTLARRAQIEYDRRDGVARFLLEDGSTHSTTPADAQGYQVSRFERQMIRKGPDESFRIRNSLLNRPLAKNFGQQNLKELAASVIKAGSTITHEETRNKVIGHILAVMHERFALPVACLVFALLGLPLGIMNRRGGRASGFSLSIGIAILYWLLLSSGTNLVRQGRLSPYIGLWLGNAVLGLAGVVLFVLRERSEHLSVRLRLPARLAAAARAAVERWRERWTGSRMRTAARRRGASSGGPVGLRAVGATADGGPGDDDLDDEASPSRRRSRRVSAIAIGAVAIAAILVAINYLPLLLVGLTLLAILMVFRTTLDRYILKRFGTILAGSLVTLFLLFTVYEFVNLLDDLVDRDLPFTMALTYFKYRTPWIVAQILPMSCLVATLMTFGLMSRFNEVTALKASGTSIYRLAVPVVLATVSLSAVAYVNGDYVVPFTSRRATQLKDEIRGRTPRSYGARERRWVFGEGGRLYNFQNYTPSPIPVLQASSGTFQGMSVYLFDPTGYAISERVYARRATYADGLWLLQDGWVRQFRAGEESFEIFAEKLFDFPEAASDFVREWRTPDQMNYGELRKFIVDLRRRGYDVQELLVDLHDKTAMPLVSFTMVLLGLPFCFRMGKRGSFYGLGVAVGLVAAFVLTFSTTNALGGTGLMPPFLAAWAPNILFSSTGVYLLLKTGT